MVAGLFLAMVLLCGHLGCVGGHAEVRGLNGCNAAECWALESAVLGLKSHWRSMQNSKPAEHKVP